MTHTPPFFDVDSIPLAIPPRCGIDMAKLDAARNGAPHAPKSVLAGAHMEPTRLMPDEPATDLTALPAKDINDEYLSGLDLEKALEKRCKSLGMVPHSFLQWEPELLHTPEEAIAERRWFLVVKRAVDILASSILVVLLLPLLPLMAAAIKLDSPGPVFSSQPRLGQWGNPFSQYKLRTLAEGSDRSSSMTIPNDPRLTRVGHFLHRSSLDSLPSLLNVLKGEMSVVGPQPIRLEDAARIEEVMPEYRSRMSVKPGLTGWAETSFDPDDPTGDLARWLAYDLYYVDFDNVSLENRIVLRTIRMALTGRWLGMGMPVYVPQVVFRLEPHVPRQSELATNESVASVSGGSAYQAVPTVRHLASAVFPLNNTPVRKREGMRRTLIVGAGIGMRVLSGWIRSTKDCTLLPVGFLEDDPSVIGNSIDDLPVLGTFDRLPTIVKREAIDVVLIAMPTADTSRISSLAASARATGAAVLLLPPLMEILHGDEKVIHLKRIDPVDALEREPVELDQPLSRAFIEGKCVLVSGAAGSIGRELVRQVFALHPEELILVDINESDLFEVHQDLLKAPSPSRIRPYVESICDRAQLERIFTLHRPQIVFHAAAYKHVPLMEDQPDRAVRTNVFGTKTLAEVASRAGVERFVLVSTDKAVRPICVMGAAKRLAEMVLSDVSNETGMSTCAVRFGNVLGSRGSVIPIFEKQVDVGGPITITDARMRRYFMTIPEAAGLIIEAGALGHDNAVYLLDMGDEVQIVKLAERVVTLRGLRPYKDIPIVFTGTRPGEKLHEDLSNDFEIAQTSPNPRIRILACRMNPDDHAELSKRLAALREIAENGQPEHVRAALHALVSWGDEKEDRYGARNDERAALSTINQ